MALIPYLVLLHPLVAVALGIKTSVARQEDLAAVVDTVVPAALVVAQHRDKVMLAEQADRPEVVRVSVVVAVVMEYRAEILDVLMVMAVMGLVDLMVMLMLAAAAAVHTQVAQAVAEVVAAVALVAQVALMALLALPILAVVEVALVLLVV
jgi:hypothetical protein